MRLLLQLPLLCCLVTVTSAWITPAGGVRNNHGPTSSLFFASSAVKGAPWNSRIVPCQDFSSARTISSKMQNFHDRQMIISPALRTRRRLTTRLFASSTADSSTTNSSSNQNNKNKEATTAGVVYDSTKIRNFSIIAHIGKHVTRKFGMAGWLDGPSHMRRRLILTHFSLNRSRKVHIGRSYTGNDTNGRRTRHGRSVAGQYGH